MKSIFTRALAGILFAALLLPSAHADRSKELPPQYRHWLNAEVNYIIDSNERKEFLSLTTDAQRDSFIEAFWRIRNPDPNSSTNSYKEEHYQRLEYVNEHYGAVGHDDGWRTDRGRIYIILGKPQQVVTYLSARNVRPMEIWFYQSPSQALPPYFNIVFYKRSTSDDFTLYSPLSDGPVRLVTTLEAMNDQTRSLETIRKSLGNEVATTIVSLIPGEPVNLHGDEYAPGMSSDLLLSEITSLPDNPLTQERLEQNRLRERVTTSLFLGGNDATLSYDTFRDGKGRLTLSYLLSMRYADPQIVGTRKDGSNYYDLILRTEIVTGDGKRAYMQEDQLTGSLTAEQAEIAKKKAFGAEARLPLAPGHYTVIATLTNKVNSSALRQSAVVTVPSPQSDKAAFSGLLAYTKPAAVPDPNNQLPFSASHFRFTPRGAQDVYIHQGERLPLVFQLWLPAKTVTDQAQEKIHIHYVFGSIASARDESTQETEEVDAANRDQAGNLLTGHTLDTSSLLPGAYQVVVSATPEDGQKTAYATLNLHVSPAENSNDGSGGTWTAYGPANAGGESVDDLKRGLSAEAQREDAAAQVFYQNALAEDAANLRALDHLASLLQRKGMTDQLAALNTQPVLAKAAVSPATLLAIAAALGRSGNPKAAARMLEEQIKIQPPSPELYDALADASQASGNTGRASEVRALAANLKK